jgi:large subunit ribosomal protein L22
MQVQSKARLKYVSIPPRKMRLVADLIRGLPVQEALDVLNFTPKIAARHLAKTVKSAAANALSQEGTDHLRPENLMITRVIVDEAPTNKRIRFQSMGRVYRYRKRYSHLTVFLEGETDRPEETTRRTRARKAEATEEGTPKATPKKKTAKKKTATKKKTTRKKAAKKKAAASKAETKSAAGDKTKKKTAAKKTVKSRKSSAAEEEE